MGMAVKDGKSVSISISDASGDVMLKSGTDPCDGSSKIDASYKPKLAHVFSNVRLRGPSSVMSMGACVPLWYAAMSPIEPTLLTGLKEFLHLRPHLPTHYNTQNSHDSLQSNNKHTHTYNTRANEPGRLHLTRPRPNTVHSHTFAALLTCCVSHVIRMITLAKAHVVSLSGPPTSKKKARHAPTTDDLLPSCRGTCCARQCGSAR